MRMLHGYVRDMSPRAPQLGTAPPLREQQLSCLSDPQHPCGDGRGTIARPDATASGPCDARTPCDGSCAGPTNSRGASGHARRPDQGAVRRGGDDRRRSERRTPHPGTTRSTPDPRNPQPQRRARGRRLTVSGREFHTCHDLAVPWPQWFLHRLRPSQEASELKTVRMTCGKSECLCTLSSHDIRT